MNSHSHLSEEILLAILVEGEPAVELQAAAHLERCAACRGKLEQLRDEIGFAPGPDAGAPVLSPEQIRLAKQRLDERVARIETTLAYETILPSRTGFWRGRRLAAAAAVLVCLGLTFAWYAAKPRPMPVEEVLSRARKVEVDSKGTPLYQSFHVEFVQVAPRRAQISGDLKEWSDPKTNRYTTRWNNSQGLLRHAVWSCPGKDEVYVYDRAHSAQVVTVGYSPNSAAGSLAEIPKYGLSAAQLAQGFLKWLEQRSWQPIYFSKDFLALVDAGGAQLRLTRFTRNGRERIGVFARKVLEGVVAQVTLELNAANSEPLALTIRFEAGGEVSEFRMRREEVRVIPVSSLDASIFQPSTTGRAMTELRPSVPPAAERAGELPGPARLGASPSARQLLDAEVSVRYALHRTGACLGEPIQITATGDGLRVSGIVDSLDIKRRVDTGLVRARLPAWVRTDIKTVAEASRESRTEASEPAAVPAPAEDETVTGRRLPVQQELEVYLSSDAAGSSGSRGPPPTVNEFTNQAAENADSVLADAWALRKLAERYGSLPGKPDPAAVAMLQEMVQSHLAAIARRLSAMRTGLSPALESILRQRGLRVPGAAQAAVSAPASGRWDTNCLRLFDSVTEIHNAVMSLFVVNLQEDAGTGRAAGGRALSADRSVVNLLLALRGFDPQIQRASLAASQINRLAPASP